MFLSSKFPGNDVMSKAVLLASSHGCLFHVSHSQMHVRELEATYNL